MAKDLIQPASASADGDVLGKESAIEEKYHIFLPYHIAKLGGSQTVTLRSGDTCQIQIPARTQECTKLTVKNRGLQGNDIFIFLHTLYDPKYKIGDKIYQEIDNTTFIRGEGSNQRCKYVYEDIEDTKYVEDFTILELLDYII